MQGKAAQAGVFRAPDPVLAPRPAAVAQFQVSELSGPGAGGEGGDAATLAAGPLIGGLLIAAVGWRSIFFINVPLGAIGWWLIAQYAAATPRAPGRDADLPGQAAAVIALTALAGATIETGSAGPGSPLVLAGYAVAAAAGAAFVEHARARPMLPLSLFRSCGFSTAVCAGLLVNLVFFGLIFAFSLF